MSSSTTTLVQHRQEYKIVTTKIIEHSMLHVSIIKSSND
uniref:Uncharacterized protein n=1 Tax=Physcomitrium patens TaxID=3218 RepID=A0A2K1K3D1_PHYPA|nr:hypothetical protein PHYPA_012755 [Physcomitrium patens]